MENRASGAPDVEDRTKHPDNITAELDVRTCGTEQLENSTGGAEEQYDRTCRTRRAKTIRPNC